MSLFRGTLECVSTEIQGCHQCVSQVRSDSSMMNFQGIARIALFAYFFYGPFYFVDRRGGGRGGGRRFLYAVASFLSNKDHKTRRVIVPSNKNSIVRHV